MQKQKLLKLAKGLRSLTRAESKHFDMYSICDASNASKFDGKILPRNLKELATCNTAACALGWTPTFFPRSKFKLKKATYGNNWLDVVYKDSKGEYVDFKAGEKFYGIGPKEVDYLFDPANYSQNTNLTPKFVARRIEEFVKTNGKSCKDYFEKLEQEEKENSNNGF